MSIDLSKGCESLSLQEPIDTKIFNTLNKYDTSTILSEQLQNSDDCKASKLIIQLDTSTYGRKSLWRDRIISNEEISKAINNEKLMFNKLIPIGGIATLISPFNEEFKGRPYFYLPIGNITTDIPVHFNGYFILSDSRTDIESKDQKKRWNDTMLKYVVSKLYAMNLEHISSNIDPDQILMFYSKIPYPRFPKEPKFEDIIRETTIDHLLKLPVFLDENTNDWFKLNEMYVNDPANPLPYFIKDILREIGLLYAELPNEMVTYIQLHPRFKSNLNFVTREELCTILKANLLSSFNHQVLDYLLMSSAIIVNGNLHGINLFPIVDGSLQSLQLLTIKFGNILYYANDLSVAKEQISILKTNVEYKWNALEKDSIREFILSSNRFNSSLLPMELIERFCSIPIFQVYPHPNYTHSNISKHTVCSDSNLVKEYSNNISIKIVDIRGIEKKFLIYDLDNRSFSRINFDLILPKLNSYSNDRVRESVGHVLKNVSHYTKNYDLNSINWVPTQDPGYFSKPQNVFYCDKYTKSLVQKMFVVNEKFCTETTKSAWIGLGIKTSLSKEDIQNVAYRISTIPFDDGLELYHYFVKYLKECPHSYTIETINSLKDYNWILCRDTIIIDDQEVICFSKGFFKPDEFLDSKYINIGYSNYFMVDGSFPKHLEQIFDPPNLESVIEHLQFIIGDFSKSSNYNSALSTIINSIYQYLQSSLRSLGAEEIIKEKLSNMKWIMVDSENVMFTDHHSVSYDLNHKFQNLEPYLFIVPSKFKSKFKKLFKLFDIPEKYDTSRYIQVLNKMEIMLNGQKMNQSQLKLSIRLVQEISNDPPSDDTRLLVPTRDEYLYPSVKVLSNGTNLTKPFPSVLTKKEFKQVHPGLSSESISKLNIQRTQSILQKGKKSIFGQEENLCSKIKELLEDYDSNSLIKEMIQNAEDSNATKFSVIYDERDFNDIIPKKDKDDLVYSPDFLQQFGPALLFYNDKPFTNEDIENIQSIGNSIKIKQESSIGKFGYGINSMYNISDIPSFVTNSEIYFFDPNQRHFEYDKYEKKGKCFEFTNREFILEDIFEPYKHYQYFGLDIDKPFNSTLFRLPLRKSSPTFNKYALSSWTSVKINNLLSNFKSQIESILLFLSNLNQVSFYHWKSLDQKEPTLVYSIIRKTQLGDNTLKKELNRIDQEREMIKLQKFEIYNLEIRKTYNRSWLIGEKIGGERPLKVYKMTQTQEFKSHKTVEKQQKRFPIGGVAIPLDHQIEGSMYCFLPLPIPIHHPIHINGYFELDNTRSTFSKYFDIDDLEITMEHLKFPDKKLRIKWNAIILEDIVAPLYLNVLVAAKNYLKPSALYSYFPKPTISFFNRICAKFYQEIPNYQLFQIYNPSTKEQWDYITPTSFVVSDKVIGNDEIPSMLKKEGEQILLIPLEIQNQLNTEYRLITPNHITKFYQNLAKLDNYQLGSNQTIKSLQKKSDIINLFNFLKNYFKKSPTSINGLPLLLLADGSTYLKFNDGLKIHLYNSEYLRCYPNPNEFLCEELSKVFKEENIPLPKSIIEVDYNTFLTKYILKNLQERTYDQIILILKEILNRCTDFSPSQIDLIRNTNLIPVNTKSPIVLKKICDMYDPSSELLKPFHGSIGINFIPEELRSTQWMKFFTLFNVKTELSHENFIEQSKILSTSFKKDKMLKSNCIEKYITKARSLVQHLHISYYLNPELLESIKDLYIVPCQQCKHLGSLESPILSSLNESANPDIQDLIFSVLPIREISIPIEFNQFTDKIHHFVNLSKIAFTKWIPIDGKHDPANMELFNKSLKYVANLEKYFSYLAGHDLDFPLPNSKEFISPKNMIFNSSSEKYEPFFISIPKEWEPYYIFFKELGTRQLESTTIIQKINGLINQEIKPQNLDAIISLFKFLIINPSNNSQLRCILSDQLILKPIEKVFYSENLRSRIKMDDIFFIHQKLEEYGKELNIKKLKDHLLELLNNEDSIIFTEEFSNIEALKNRIRSTEFINGLNRFIGSLKLSTENRYEILKFFKDLEIFPTQIHSRYLFNGKDITLEPLGSIYIFDKEKTFLYLDIKIVNTDEEMLLPIFVNFIKEHLNLSLDTMVFFNTRLDFMEKYLDILGVKKLDIDNTPNTINTGTEIIINSPMVKYTKNQVPYQLDPISEYEIGEEVLFEYDSNNSDEMVQVKIESKSPLSNSELKYYTIVNREKDKLTVPSIYLYKKGTNVEGYQDRLFQVNQFVREVKSSSLSKDTINHGLNRLRKHTSYFNETERTHVEQMISEIDRMEYIEKTIMDDSIFQWQTRYSDFQSPIKKFISDCNEPSPRIQRFPKQPTLKNRLYHMEEKIKYESNSTKPATKIIYSYLYSPPEPDLIQSINFFEKAKEDFKAISQSENIHSKICFWSQQVVEKCLKSILFTKKIYFDSRTHSIKSLMASMGNIYKSLVGIHGLDKLDQYYIWTRYPYNGKNLEYTEQDSEQAKSIATQVFKNTSSVLGYN
eukprot:gene5633-7011_t